MITIQRREFITLLGGAAAAWSLAARAQQAGKVPVIGFLGSQNAELYESRLKALRKGLSEVGYVEGPNLAIEYRWANSHDDRLPQLAMDLVRRRVAVIVTSGTTPSVAAKDATKTIPIVFALSSDPVQLGLVASLSRPGANATGSTNLGVEVGPKRLELLHELVPAVKIVALLINPNNPGVEAQATEHETAARLLGLELRVFRASTEPEIDSMFMALPRLGVEALVIGPDVYFNTRSDQLAALALRHRIPTIFNDRPFAAAGGLISYGASLTDQYRLLGTYAGRILKGEKPADLPVQQSVKIELIINMKTAKTLGVPVPLTLQVAADEVIE